MKNLTQIGLSGIDFFATGNENIRDGLNLNYIPVVKSCKNDVGGGINLADTDQDLQQSYLIAKQVFEQVKSNTIRFVLIGLSPYIFSSNDKELPSVCLLEEKILEDYIKLCLGNGAKPVIFVLPVKQSLRKTYNANALKAFRDTIKRIVNKYNAAFIDLLDIKISDKLFQAPARLNSDGSLAITALLSDQLYFKDILSPMDICNADNDFFNVVPKYFSRYVRLRNHWYNDRPLTQHIFCKMACDDFNRLSEVLPKETCIDLMTRVFQKLTYSYLAKLSRILPKDDYNNLAARIFKISAEKLRRKDKIKVGFVLYDSSTWCGNNLYNFFAQDERFEPTVFLCIRTDAQKNNALQKELLHQTEQFKSNGLNVVALDSKDSTAPEQDLIIYLIPYDQRLPKPFQILNISTKTLLAYIPYSIEVGKTYDATFTSIVRVAWKQFLPSKFTLEMYNKKSEAGTPQRIYSGYPKLDIFFKSDSKFHFDWKMAHPDAKKIIWAPHHSILGSIKTATFQWNYQFMYEIAKAHPEISWVVKPHSNLPLNAINGKVFPSLAAYEEYMQKWDDLPNAKVVTGAYYQAIFATSDGMIHDCGSFTAEYQYVDKPMIYLTCAENKHNELGNKILSVSYTVDGKNLNGIAALIKRVIIEGDDYKAAERKEVFDKHLNYPQDNGILASEFIFKNIADELKASSV